jgi:hypothetical protein
MQVCDSLIIHLVKNHYSNGKVITMLKYHQEFQQTNLLIGGNGHASNFWTCYEADVEKERKLNK